MKRSRSRSRSPPLATDWKLVKEYSSLESPAQIEIQTFFQFEGALQLRVLSGEI